MKRFLRCASAVMVLVLLLAVPGHAEEATHRASSFFMSYDSSIYQATSEVFEIWFDVVSLGAMDELGVSSIKVQRSSDGSKWITMKTFTPDQYPQMICEDTSFHCDYVSYIGTPGNYYRAYVIFYAKNSTGIGERAQYSETILL